MKYLVTSAEMKEYDNRTIERIGIPALVLMERAALAVRDEICALTKLHHTCKKVLIAVGSGNNGADGLALGRLLCGEGYQVYIYECGSLDKTTDSYKKQRNILQYYPVSFLKELKEIEAAYDFVVDGIFGVGLSRMVNEKYAQIIQRLNETKAIKIAVDIPSGIDATTGEVMGCAFRADLTVTFGFAKYGLYLYPGTEYAGKIVTASIGIDESSFFGDKPQMFYYDENIVDLLPDRKKNGNKGTFGKVLLIAGWEHMAGAAILCGKALLQTGAGMVKVFCSEENRTLLQCAFPEAMYGDADSLLKDLDWADVVVMGPGLGQSAKAQEVLGNVLKEISVKEKRMVLDADALNLIPLNESLKEAVKACGARKVVMTPHMGELSRLYGESISYVKSHIMEVAKETSLDYDSVMVCKDARTLIYEDAKPMCLNVVGNSGMATAGSGDVLAGIIGALLAQGMDTYEAACVGVYLHALAGDGAAQRVSEYGVTASRIISQIEELMKGS